MQAIIFDWSRTLQDTENRKLFPGVKKLLERLGKKYKLAMITRRTDGEFDERINEIKDLGVWDFFEDIAIVLEKAPEQYSRMCMTLNVSPKDTLVVGDKAQGEVTAAWQAGCRTCWLRKGKYKDLHPAFAPTLIIEDLSELSEKI